MIPPLDHQPEEFSPTGNLASEGARNQLGRPDLHPLVLLVRETIQNSWDAKRPDVDTVSYSLHGWELDDAQRRHLRQTVFDRTQADLGVRRALDDRQSPLHVLCILDRGTSGLAGPTRADQISTESHDFVDFLRNIGQRPDKQLGGGTYGYGKAALYINSLVSTICVHSRCLANGRLQSRFMAVQLGRQFEMDGRRYTGRHWWGRRANDGIVDPVLDDEADLMAREIGMPVDQDALGTTIALLAPDFREDPPVKAMQLMADSIAWFFWPKMLPVGDAPAGMRFDVRWNGATVAIPSPETDTCLKHFTRAWQMLHADDSGVVQIRRDRPRAMLGRLAVRQLPERGMKAALANSPLRDGVHHVALMRSPRLIVKYLDLPLHPESGMGYAGVFLAEDDADRAFAAAEPPSHDDWIPRSVVDKNQRSLVTVALRRIKDQVAQQIRPSIDANTVGTDLPLAGFADVLGELLPGTEGSGARVRKARGRRTRPQRAGEDRTSAGRVPARQPPRVLTREDPALVLVAGQKAIRVTFSVQAPEGISQLVVTAAPFVELDGGSIESDPPANAEAPLVLGWEGPAQTAGPAATLQWPFREEYAVIVSVPDMSRVGVRFHLREGGD